MAKIVFMGTPGFALPSLSALLAAHEVLAVVTQPDRPAGRNKRLRQSPVKRLAASRALPILQPARLRAGEAADSIRRYSADLFVVVAYGQILPQTVLALPRFGTINVHASLLPRWRGAAPIQAAIRAGDSESGVTIMLLDAGLDTGPILAQQALDLTQNETGASLHDKLAKLGADLLADTIPRYLSGEIKPLAQAETGVTYAPQIRKEEGEIDWRLPAVEIERLVRAFSPWPGTYTYFAGEMLKISAGYCGAGAAEAGAVQRHARGIAIGTGSGLYFPLELQRAGKQRLHIADFVRGTRGFIGARLGA